MDEAEKVEFDAVLAVFVEDIAPRGAFQHILVRVVALVEMQLRRPQVLARARASWTGSSWRTGQKGFLTPFFSHPPSSAIPAR